MKSASNQKWIGMVGALAGLLTGVVAAQTPAGPATPGAASQALVEPAMAAPQLRHVAARTGHQSVQLALEISGDYQFHPLSSGSRLLLVDLPGVSTREASVSHLMDSPLVSSYRVVGYLRESQPSARLEVLLKLPASVEYLKTARGLEVRLAAIPAAPGQPTASAPATAPAVAPVAGRSTSASAVRGDRLNRIEIARGPESGNVQVQVRSNGVLQYKAFELREPRRLVLDIPNVVSNSSVPVSGIAGMSPVRQVRVGQFQQAPPITRVVLELDTQAAYDLRPSAEGLEIEFRSTRSEAPARPVAAQPVATALQMPSISERMPNSVDAVFASVRNLMSTSKVDLVEAPAATPTPEPQQTETPQSAAPAALLQARKAPVETALAQQMAVQPRPSGTPAAQAPAARRYTGEPISINVKDVDLKDFFRLIHEISGLNVILDKGVTGTLTMVLDDVPWDQALDIVLRNNQLDSVLDGNVLRIATLDSLKREQQAMADLAKAQADTVDRVTISRSVNYAKAAELAGTIRKFLSARADIIADERTNQLIITDIPQSIPTVDEVLRQLDKRTQQVEIEARIVAASRQFVRELGAQFGFSAFAGTRNTVLGGNPLGADSPISARPFTPPFVVGGGQAIPLFSNFPAAGGNVGFTISNNTPDFSLDLILTAAESRGIGKTLSRPKIVTQNNQRGSIQQGVQIPIQTTVNNTVSTQLQDVTLAMTVTPQVTPDNNIFLEITVTNRNIAAGVPRINGIPALNKQEATTRVLVADGATVVFGGVIANENNLTIQQVPILGSIPLIGNLFKRTGVSTSTNELLFFITPKII